MPHISRKIIKDSISVSLMIDDSNKINHMSLYIGSYDLSKCKEMQISMDCITKNQDYNQLKFFPKSNKICFMLQVLNIGL